MAERKHKTKAHIPIDWKKVDNFLIAGCTGIEIASTLGVHHDTLYDACVREKGVLFSEYTAKMRSKGDSLLRAKQFEKAMAKDNTMLVWLGKNRLGQKERPESQEFQNSFFKQFMDYVKENATVAKPEADQLDSGSDETP